MSSHAHQRTHDMSAKPKLYAGLRISREEFHRAYKLMPESYKAELIDGVVHEPSPVSYSHGRTEGMLGYLFGNYAASTLGVEFEHNGTVILSEQDELQPDLVLLVNSKHRGQSRITKDDYIEGAPELVAEIAISSRTIDLNLKKKRYALAGVLEYLVVNVKQKRIHWFDLSKQQVLKADEGIFRSLVFPGLWIHSDALLQFDFERSINTLKVGLRSLEHQEFISKLSLAKVDRTSG